MPALSIHDEILNNMTHMRVMLGQRFKWFCHVTPIENVASIRANGLMPRRDKSACPIVEKYVGPTASEIICINPLGSDQVPPAVQEGPKACIAFCREALPRRLSLDWSCDGGFGIAEVLRAQDPNRDAADIFVESAKRWGSIVVYDPIPAQALRAFVQERAPHDPSRWPLLTNVNDNLLLEF